MSDKVKSLYVYKKLSEVIEQCRRDLGLCEELIKVLNEISNSNEMRLLVSAIMDSNVRKAIDISKVINESADTRNALYDFLIILQKKMNSYYNIIKYMSEFTAEELELIRQLENEDMGDLS